MKFSLWAPRTPVLFSLMWWVLRLCGAISFGSYEVRTRVSNINKSLQSAMSGVGIVILLSMRREDVGLKNSLWAVGWQWTEKHRLLWSFWMRVQQKIWHLILRVCLSPLISRSWWGRSLYFSIIIYSRRSHHPLIGRGSEVGGAVETISSLL